MIPRPISANLRLKFARADRSKPTPLETFFNRHVLKFALMGLQTRRAALLSESEGRQNTAHDVME
jgi:hypothetical protein